MATNREGIQTAEIPSYNVYVSGWGPNPKLLDNLATSISTLSIKNRLQIRWRSTSNGSDMIGCNRQDEILRRENKREGCCLL